LLNSEGSPSFKVSEKQAIYVLTVFIPEVSNAILYHPPPTLVLEEERDKKPVEDMRE
jgi:hypothetical protein